MIEFIKRLFNRNVAPLVPFKTESTGLLMLNDGTCPDCRQHMFIEGPQGGGALNIKCAGCGSKFWFSPPFTPERIDNSDQFYTRPPIDLREQ